MFVVSSTAYGISQRLLAYAQMVDALARAQAPASAMDKSQIYQVANTGDAHDAVAAVGGGKGVYVDTVRPSAPEPPSGSAAAKAQIITVMTNEMLGGAQ